ncbi:MAG TPA: peptide-methionine (S)-S-oxide reductase [Trebonia sp.]|nr:peptide-methionine (S)-S-oxide reductase [Trebonia sp.]
MSENTETAILAGGCLCTSGQQRQIAEDTIADAGASDMWPGRVVTKISEAGPFWEAETEDQNYLQRYPTARISSTRSCPGHVAAPVLALQSCPFPRFRIRPTRVLRGRLSMTMDPD